MLDDAIPRLARDILEDRFWRPIERASTIEGVRASADPLEDPAHHPFLFADHGVVHVRDIAEGVIQLAAAVDGVLLPRRDADRQSFLVACGVGLTYLHDIGMIDPTPEGRRIHPMFASHTCFGRELDDVVPLLVSSDWHVTRRIRAVHAVAPFDVPLDVVIREVLSLSIAHSKSTVPASTLDDPTALRAQVLAVVLTPLDDLRAGAPPALRDGSGTPAAAYYDDVRTQAFSWLTSSAPCHRAFVDDVVDAVRVLRAADALRQRGATLRTAGGYEIFMEAATGEAVYALRDGDGSRLLWVRVPGAISAGEANLRSAWITPQGDLRVSFHRGSFLSPAAARRAVDATAEAIDDIQADVLPSFTTTRPRDGLAEPARAGSSITVQLERPHDRPDFAADVAQEIVRRRPSLVDRLVLVADVEGAEAAERERYHASRIVGAETDEAASIVRSLHDVGINTDGLDPVRAFEDVRRATVVAGETLVVAGSPPAFVYLPTTDGLVVHPLGGYAAEPARPWLPIGGTGVVRNAERNSDVVAEADVQVVMVPGEVFAREWFRPYDGAMLGGLIHGPR